MSGSWLRMLRTISFATLSASFGTCSTLCPGQDQERPTRPERLTVGGRTMLSEPVPKAPISRQSSDDFLVKHRARLDRLDTIIRDINESGGLKGLIPIDRKHTTIELYDILDCKSPPIPGNGRGPVKNQPPRVIRTWPKLQVASIPLRDQMGVLLVAVFADGSPSPRQPSLYEGVTIIPVVRGNVKVLQLSPGDAKYLVRVQRVPGGTAITVPEFDASTVILCTADEILAESIRLAVDRNRLTPIVFPE